MPRQRMHGVFDNNSVQAQVSSVGYQATDRTDQLLHRVVIMGHCILNCTTSLLSLCKIDLSVGGTIMCERMPHYYFDLQWPAVAIRVDSLLDRLQCRMSALDVRDCRNE